MTVHIRTLSEADAASYRSLRLRGLREHPEAFSSSYEEECERSLHDVAARLRASDLGVAFGAFVGEQLAGSVGVYRDRHRKLAHRAMLVGMYVAPEHRKLSIGRALVERAVQHATTVLRARQVVLGVGADNAAAIALYRGVGFEPFGVERDYLFADGQYHDEMHMIRFLYGTAR